MSIADKLDANPHVIPNWRRFLKFWSVRISIGGFLIALGQAFMLSASAIQFRNLLDTTWTWAIIACTFVASLIGRLIQQEPPDDDPAKDNQQHG